MVTERKNKIIIFVVYSLIIVIMAGCSSSLSPPDTLMEFFNAAKRKEYSKASKYISSRIITNMGTQEFCDRWVDLFESILYWENDKKGGIIEGESATVFFKFMINEKGRNLCKAAKLEPGSAATVKMLMENGRWKVNGFHETLW